MTTARELRKKHLGEYLLYMWLVEDLIRATGCSHEGVDRLMARYPNASPELQAEIRGWYYELIEMMRTEGKQTSGHLDINRIVLIDLEGLHRELLANPNDIIYQGMYHQILPAIVQLRSRGMDSGMSDLEVVFTALYGRMAMSLSGKEVNPDTEKSLEQFNTFIDLLAHKHQLAQEGEGYPS